MAARETLRRRKRREEHELLVWCVARGESWTRLDAAASKTRPATKILTRDRERGVHWSIDSMNGPNGVNGLSGMPYTVGVNIFWDFTPIQEADLLRTIETYEYYLPQLRPALLARENHSPASIEKLFYREHFATARRTPAETNEFRKANNVTVRGRAVPTPILGLYEANFPECVTEAAYALNYGPLSALQSQCWPVALHGRDLVAIAHTRAPANEQAYLLPAISDPQGTAPLCSYSFRPERWQRKFNG
ncbi:hypothetical protein HPB52_018162 [Rhipicephalus sanguineus]|uniref:Uncharacterized protein n=1 Tax=Rhipicephalus sanguineus TaxID=34632 RepID=A0A9D4PC18_RHISA|nr:hypothetical protein HPB52_018162 [Rhipicephalus sanguineus]